MQKGVIHIAGIMGLLFLAASALPRVNRDIETRLKTELNAKLARQGLTGIEGHFSGQTLTLAYARNAIDLIDTDEVAQLSPRMAEAEGIARHLDGGLALPGGAPELWGPLTQVSVDQASINSLARQMEMRRSQARDDSSYGEAP